MNLLYSWHDSCVLMWNMTFSHVWHDPSICVHMNSHVSHITTYPASTHVRSSPKRKSSSKNTRFPFFHRCIPSCMYAMTHPYEWHDSFVLATRLIYVCDLTHSCLHSHLTCMMRGGGLGWRPRKMYGERFGDGVEYHLMSPTPRR